MLNDIRLHVDADEKRQTALEQEFATKIDELQQKNAIAFSNFIPTIAQVLPQLPFTRLSVFLDKHEQSNIVDFNTGNTLYGPYPNQTIVSQVENWPIHSALLDLNDGPNLLVNSPNAKNLGLCLASDSYADLQEYGQSINQNIDEHSIDTLVVLGLGKALHLELLLRNKFGANSRTESLQNLNPNHQIDNNACTPKLDHLTNIVIYEPDWEVFRCSLAVFDWSYFLQKAQQLNLQVFMQIGSNPNVIFDEISELNQKLNAKRILFYKHINSPLYINIIQNVRFGNWGRAVIEPLAQHAKTYQETNAHNAHPLFASTALDSKKWRSINHKSEKQVNRNQQFVDNMALFAEYFPDIHSAFIDYKPQCWETLIHSSSKLVNMFNKQSASFYAGDQAKVEGQMLMSHFAKYPNLDGLIFGYTGDKLKHYLHNTFIRQADMLLRQNEQSDGELPEQVKAIIMFGLGSGYLLEALCGKHDIQNLIICEPNPDFFFAALHAIDWRPIFEKIKKGEHKLYINIGEASSRLFKDLMSQFLVLGPHLLNETFIAQAYNNPMLSQVLFEVRQQLKVIFSMGENFDHVAYGIAHTTRALSQNVPALRYQPAQYMSKANRQLPIFVIGNGPSLDQNIDIIKEYRDQVIVVSCGTALQSLYTNGITPDFHGEVEQNRANFDWASRINDRAYLKQITLLSVNGIHPDTYSLYKNVLIAFKTGESSTHALLATMPKNSFACLDHAYPTVTNMVLSFFLTLGFEQLYLVGVDLGFADQNKHHSSASGYYENGKQLYDYKAFHAADLRVKGNKQDWVFTKTEFNISRMIIEQLLLEHKRTRGIMFDCFNLSNGVFIEGTVALESDSVLVMSTSEEKQASLQNLDACFMSVKSNVSKNLYQAYQQPRLQAQFESLGKTTSLRLINKAQIQHVIEQLSALLYEARSSGKSLFFYYFFNSINYLSAALNKASLQNNEQQALADCQRLLDLWQVFLLDAQAFIQQHLALLDTAQAYGDRREKFLLKDTSPVSYFTFNHELEHQIKRFSTETSPTCFFEFPDLLGLDSFLYTESIENNVLQKIIFDVGSQQECTDVANLLHSPTVLIAEVGLVFHDYALLTWFETHHPIITNNICLLYCSPLLTDISSTSLKQDEILSGEQDYLLDSDYFHLLLARSQDLKRFSKIVCKPQFSKTGLKNAKQFTIDNNLNKAVNNLSGNKTLSQADIENYENEYTSISVATIEKKFAPLLNQDCCYMFKQYLALPVSCKARLSANDDNNTVSNLSITQLDTLENRGLLMSRNLFAFEMLGPWQDALPNEAMPNEAMPNEAMPNSTH